MTIETLEAKIQDAVINVTADSVTDQTTVGVARNFDVYVFEAEANTYNRIKTMRATHLYDFEADEFKTEAVRELAMNAFNAYN